jgi:hypothetical protein
VRRTKGFRVSKWRPPGFRSEIENLQAKCSPGHLVAASATFAKWPACGCRARVLIVSPDSLDTACPPSDRNFTYRPVQILEVGSDLALLARHDSDLTFGVCFRPAVRRANVNDCLFIQLRS